MKFQSCKVLLDEAKTKLTATADAGYYYALEASPDLISWYPFEEFLMTSNVRTFERETKRSGEFFRLQAAVAEPFILSLTNMAGSILTL